MKLLVFAHTPPPHHGQSYMVKLMLDGFGGDVRNAAAKEHRGPIECYHVNARYSNTLEDVGSLRLGKLFLLLRYCAEAIYLRARHGISAFYYVPAPGKRAALVRDWLVMLLCRPFFKHFVHHWHSVGLGDWLAKDATWIERRITHLLLGRPSLGLSLAIPSMRDALWFRSKQVELTPNGIPDPCPDFDPELRAQRIQRLAARRALLAGKQPPDLESGPENAKVFRVLFLGNLLRDKGIFDTLEAISICNSKLRNGGIPIEMHLAVAGAFPEGTENRDFHARIEAADLKGLVTWKGFVSGTDKTTLLKESDCLCFPSYYHAESFGLVVVEAMAAGMPVVTTRWRALADLLPPEYPGVAAPRCPTEVAVKLIHAITEDATPLREWYLRHFTETVHLHKLEKAILTVSEVN